MKRIVCFLLAPLLLMAGAGCARAAGGGAAVTFFKAGKADAAVIQSEGAVLLVDTGLAKNGDELIEALEDLGVTRIDALIVSHFDKDHVGGAAAVLRRFAVGAVYQSNSPKDSDEYAAYEAALAAADITPVTVTDTVSFTLGGLSVTIDGPAQTAYKKDPSNNSSLIATVVYGGTTLLFAGDAEDARITEYLASYERGAGGLVLKVPYHGHWQDTLPAFLTAVEPDAAILCCSKSEPDADERERTEAYLATLGADVYRTFEGDITLTLTGTGYTITQ